MKESDDIANLFRHFDGQPGQYQEISRANEARQSRERWPLLASIEADQAAQFPPVGRIEPHLSAAPASPLVEEAAHAPQAAQLDEPLARTEPAAPHTGAEPRLQALFARLERSASPATAENEDTSFLERLNRL